MSTLSKSLTANATKFEELWARYSGASIAEKGELSGMAIFDRMDATCTAIGGSASNGTGWLEVHRVVRLDLYKGELTPLHYAEHWAAVNRGERERDYNGMLVKWSGRQWVLCEGYRVTPSNVEVVQMSLF